MGMALVMNHVVNSRQRKQDNSVLAVHFTVRGILPVGTLNRRTTSVIKVGIMWVVKIIVGIWLKTTS